MPTPWELFFDEFEGLIRVYHNDTPCPHLLERLAEANFDVLNFSHEMDIGEVKARMGHRVALMGNVPPLDVGVRDTPPPQHQPATLPPGETASPIPGPARALPSSTLRAGLRSSPYGPSPPFPDPDYWVSSASSMASRFDGSGPAVVWIVGTMNFPTMCMLNFPSPGGKHPNISFSNTDQNEAYLDLFDQTGVQVWLQVEPADADVPTLIDLVLGRYTAHPSVIGFGMDVEWYKWSSDKEGVAVTDAEAQAWSEQVRSYNPDYRIFFKHWLPSKMPPTCRDGVMFLDDSQMFHSMDQMVAEFDAWGRTFAPAPVGFQYGYQADKEWWSALSDPPQDIGQELVNRIPNATDLYWVDFTMEQIWPRQ